MYLKTVFNKRKRLSVWCYILESASLTNRKGLNHRTSGASGHIFSRSWIAAMKSTTGPCTAHMPTSNAKVNWT